MNLPKFFKWSLILLMVGWYFAIAAAVIANLLMWKVGPGESVTLSGLPNFLISACFGLTILSFVISFLVGIPALKDTKLPLLWMVPLLGLGIYSASISIYDVIRIQNSIESEQDHKGNDHPTDGRAS